MAYIRHFRDLFGRFARDTSGVTSIEFVIVFPVFFAFFLMTVESGMISVRSVMLERAVDVTIREVRLGKLSNPTREDLRDKICEVATIIPDCANQIQMELTRMDPTVVADWTGYSVRAECVDRGEPDDEPGSFIDSIENNQLMIMRTCVRINPFLPTSVLGKTIIRASEDDTAAQGSYSLVSTSAFVVEPYQKDPV